jgi:hypothetical protein
MKLRSTIFITCVSMSGFFACGNPDTIDYPRPTYSDSTASSAATKDGAQGNPMINPTAQQNIATGPAPKINPPHGEPGHRCDIAVGAPLDGSAPAPKVASTPAVTQSPVQLTPQVTQVSTSDDVTATTSDPVTTADNPAQTDAEQPTKSDDTDQKP